jgi:pimeloyl-ACP methyl ester carboxylesterase
MLWRTALLVIAMAGAAYGAPARWEELPMPPAMPQAASNGHVEVAGAQIYYATYGQGSPVVLLHGGMGNADHWGFQVPALAGKFRVIVIDSRGQGRSTLATGKLTYHAMADDVLAVMDALSVKAAAIVGWSDGGEIALDLAVNHPERVSKLFVFGANYDIRGSKPHKQGSATFSAYAAKCRSDFAKIAPDPRAYDTTASALLPVWRDPKLFTKEQLRSIKVPTLVADGDHDEIIALDQVKEMAVIIPNARLVVFRDASHFALWQDPAAFNAALVDFLSH